MQILVIRPKWEIKHSRSCCSPRL